MKSERILKWLAIAAIIFGILTVFSGGRALFGGMEARAELGNIVPFVLWFNFSAGFVYILAGVALLRTKGWAGWAASMALLLAVSTVLVFLAFVAHIVAGGAFEARTLGALSLRSLFWIAVALVALRAMKATAAGSSLR